MSMYHTELKACITSPEVIIADTKYSDRELYHKRIRQKRGAPLWIKVVVSFAEDETGEVMGEVITAFLTHNLVGGEILWMPPHLKL